MTKAAEAIGVVKRVQQQGLKFQVDYKNFDEIQYYLKQNQIFIDQIEYGVKVAITLFIDENKLEQLKNDLNNLLAGKVNFELVPKRYNEIDIANFNYHDQ